MTRAEIEAENEDDLNELEEFRQQDYGDRIAAYKETLGINDEEQEEKEQEMSAEEKEKAQREVLVPLLAMQCYHLPGKTWCQDFVQYIVNNHPVLGICCHHKFHPLGAKTRLIALFGTLVFGLALTSIFEVMYIKNPEYQREIWVFERDGETWVLTSAMLSLWTIGGAIQTGYNLFMWHLAACSCCREGGCLQNIKCCYCPNFGKTFLRIFIFFILVMTLVIVCLRVVIATDSTAEITDVSNLTNLDNFSNAEDFGFALAYLVGMALSLFIYYPVGTLILFSGILGCFRLPVLGGRPREVAIERKILEKAEKDAS